jgi:molybdenum cofactor biosynthesis protein B
MSGSSFEHKREAESLNFEPRVGILVISSSRYVAIKKGMAVNDESGDRAEEALRAAGYQVRKRSLVDDDVGMIRLGVLKMLIEDGCNVCFTIGGTGVSKRDVTIEALVPLFDKELPGFAQLFREKSAKYMGTAALLTRSTAGIVSGAVVFCLPGSPDAASLGVQLAVPELKHLLYIVNK